MFYLTEKCPNCKYAVHIHEAYSGKWLNQVFESCPKCGAVYAEVALRTEYDFKGRIEKKLTSLGLTETIRKANKQEIDKSNARLKDFNYVTAIQQIKEYKKSLSADIMDLHLRCKSVIDEFDYYFIKQFLTQTFYSDPKLFTDKIICEGSCYLIDLYIKAKELKSLMPEEFNLLNNDYVEYVLNETEECNMSFYYINYYHNQRPAKSVGLLIGTLTNIIGENRKLFMDNRRPPFVPFSDVLLPIFRNMDGTGYCINYFNPIGQIGYVYPLNNLDNKTIEIALNDIALTMFCLPNKSFSIKKNINERNCNIEKLFCWKCGIEISFGSEFCYKCGSKINK